MRLNICESRFIYVLCNGNGTYDFVTTGYDYFGNSYTAPIVIAAFLNALDASLYECTVWLYDPGADTYIDINPLTALLGAKRYQKTPTEPITEIRSLQAFILNKVGSGSAATVSVIASNGMEVMRADAVNAAMQTVDLSGLAAGAYIIRVGDALLKAVK